VVCFQIVLHIKDIDLLYKIQEYFEGVGSITISKERCIFMANGHSDIVKVILPHFDAYPLITRSFGLPSAAAGGDRGQKLSDYLLFRKAVLDFIQYKKHLTLEGLEGLVAIRASMNLGLKDSIKKDFMVSAIQRPVVQDQSVPHGF
jgi:hypothetical protein